MSSSRQRLIEKGLGLINPMILKDQKLKKDVLKYIDHQLKEKECKVAILYIHSTSFCQFLEKHHLDPEEFLGRRELLITASKVSFTENFYVEPKELKLN